MGCESYCGVLVFRFHPGSAKLGIGLNTYGRFWCICPFFQHEEDFFSARGPFVAF